MSLQSPYLQGADPFFISGGAVGCVVTHGFMASPGEVRWLGEYLGGQGFTIYAPRLPGHGTDPADMLRVSWRDWLAAVKDGYHLLSRHCEQIFLVGHSMGGTLSLRLAEEVPTTGVVSMAAPIDLTRAWRRANWLHHFKKYSHQPPASDLVEQIKAEQSRRGEPTLGRVRYEDWALKAVGELANLIDNTRLYLSHLSAPLCLIYSHNDQTVPISHQTWIGMNVSSSTLIKHQLHQSGHILTQDSERDQVFAWAADFIREQSALAADVSQGAGGERHLR